MSRDVALSVVLNRWIWSLPSAC